MADPVVAAERFLYTTLVAANITGNRVYGDIVLPTAARPYILYTMVAAAPDVSEVSAIRIMSVFVYIVRIVDKTESYVSLEGGSTAITTALHRASGSNVSGAIVGCFKEEPYKDIELDPDGSQLRHLGGRFRLYVQ